MIILYQIIILYYTVIKKSNKRYQSIRQMCPISNKIIHNLRHIIILLNFNNAFEIVGRWYLRARIHNNNIKYII